MKNTPTTRLYTLHIGEKPILVFSAGSYVEAQSLLKEKWLLEDLRELKSDKKPLWDGKEKLTVDNSEAAARSRYEREVKNHQHEDLPIIYLIDLY